MVSGKQAWSDEHVERIMGNLLRAGVILAALWVFVGGLMYLVGDGSAPPNYRVFQGEPADLRQITGIVRGVSDLGSRNIIQFGLLLLIATPIARVAFSVFAFALERDWLYVVVTLFVLTLLIYSLIGRRL